MPIVLSVKLIPIALSTVTPTRVDMQIEPRFEVGQRVRMKTIQPLGHKRLVRHVRGREGVVEADFGVFIFPDARTHGDIPSAQHVYSVGFTAWESLGADEGPGKTLRLGLWEEYLEPVDGNSQ